jgi:hypothetical protein
MQVNFLRASLRHDASRLSSSLIRLLLAVVRRSLLGIVSVSEGPVPRARDNQ